MSRRFKLTIYSLTILLFSIKSLASQAAETGQPTNRRIDLPFVHIGIHKRASGRKDVDIKAPFTNVHNPAGPNNAEIKAPFTKVEHENSPSPPPTSVPTNKPH